ncbi:LlaJI family restriction endonuclease [Lactobacillus intestinalis]|uniref:LlaJI restriction endonuclease n=1 Tax=Lactobacillus intestinalis DSM 6629 TaxID=1423761 RepID=A0ABR5PQF9_9LACO|nr:LlaJI family restriction endonuclease [Lactobacillus intestinalis]KRM33603.1 hypothetical protein FC44_GL001049 [Lactobacillus intestinalis DSM 6629]UTW40020.1 LlaJI family restriction endonuclease [Lactobacillus intestinalis]
MMKDELKIFVIEDGKPVSSDIIQKFNLQIKDLSKNSDSEIISDFVGIVRRESSILFSMPKHYYDKNEFDNLDITKKLYYIKLVMNTIFSSVLSNTYSEFHNSDLETDLSFESFYKIYDYYKKFGLFYKKRTTVKKGYKGHISWHRVLTTSKKIISNGNLLFLPLYVDKKVNDETLITRCMIFAINYTNYLFSLFVDLPNASGLSSFGIDRTLLDNRSLVISKLKNLQNKIFKDIDIRLLDNLITFFEGLNFSSEKIHDLKFQNFNNIWEKAVEKYLNNYFQCVNNDRLIFSKSKVKNNFSKIPFSEFNLANTNHTLEPDHYFYNKSNDIQYIFDSKYYTVLKNFDYKEFSYHILLMNRAATTYDALIMPTRAKNRTEQYIQINKNYLPKGINSVKIYLVYLNMIHVLKNFID